MDVYRYRAFISYSHADDEWGRWLHKALEGFRTPAALVAGPAAGQPPSHRPVPARLTPVFRDRADLPAGGSLRTEILDALKASEFLVVLCSPSAAASYWVNEEILAFQSLGRSDRILALIVDGEPFAADRGFAAHEECFPEALRFEIGDDGGAKGRRAEPLAADARAHRDGKRRAFLKIAAGILGLKLDDLVRRDAARRTRVLFTITLGALSISAIMILLAGIAIAQRAEAERRRADAERLIEFMLDDLRRDVDRLGNLKVLEKIGSHALDYYASQDAGALPDDALSRRAKAMLLVGEISQRRNALADALRAFETAHATTEELLQRAPRNADRVFDHAQAVFYLGQHAAITNDLPAALGHYHRYRTLAEQLSVLEPNSSRAGMELAYASNNLGQITLAMGEKAEALGHFSASIAARRRLAQENPSNDEIARGLAAAASNLATLTFSIGDFQATAELLQEERRMLDRQLAERQEDHDLLGRKLLVERRLAETYFTVGEIDRIKAHLDQGEAIARQLLDRDASQVSWVRDAAYVALARVNQLEREQGPSRAADAARRAISLSAELVSGPQADSDHLRLHLLALGRRVLVTDGAPDRNAVAEDLQRRVERVLELDQPGFEGHIAYGALALSRWCRERGADDEAVRWALRGIEAMEPASETVPLAFKLVLARLHLEAGQKERALPIAAELEQAGLRRPDFIDLLETLR